MAVLSTLLVRIDADIDGLTRGFTAAERAANSLAGRMESLGRGLTIGVTLPLGVLGATAVSAAADMDRLERGLLAVTGSASATADQLDRLEEVAKLPGLGFREAIQGSIRLQAARIEAGLAERMMVAFGNAVAAAGGRKADLDGVTLALQDIAGRGQVAAQEINRLAERAPQVRAALVDAFGTADTERIQKLKLSSTDFFVRLTEQMEKIPRVSGGVSNSFENLADAVFRAQAAIGKQLLPVVVPLVEGLAKMLERVRTLDPNIVRWGIAIGAVAAVMGPLLILVGAMTAAVTALASAIGVGLLPLVLVGGPLILGLGALSAMFVKNKLDALSAAAAADAYKASLIGLSETELLIEQADIDRQIFEQSRAVEALAQARKGLDRAFAGSEDQIGFGAGKTGFAPPVSDRPLRRAQAELDTLTSKADELRQQLERVRSAADSAGGATPIVPPGGSAGADKLADTLAYVTAQLREFTFAARFGAASVAQLPEPLQKAFQEVEQARERVDSLTEALARLGSRAPVGSARALVGLQADLAASEQALDQLAVKLEKGLARPNIPTLRVQDSTRFRADALNELRVMDTVVRKITQGVSAQELEWRKTHGALDGFLAVAEGLEHVLRGLEAVGEGASQTLSDIVELTRAAKQLRDAMRPSPETGLPNFGAALTGAVGVLGTALSIGSQLLGESASARELRLTLERNVQALDALRQEINGFRLSFDVQGGLASQIDAFLAGLPDIALRSPGAFDVNVDLERVLSRFGVSLDELRAAAERFGIEIFDSSGKLILGALNQLSEALRISALSVEKFAQTVEGQRKLLEARREIADITDPAVALADEFAFLLRGLSERAEIDFGLVGLDLSSAGGRAALDAALLKLIDSALAGTLDASMLAGFESVDEFIDHLLSTDRALDAFSQTANRAASSMVNVVEGFKIAQFRFDATREAAAVAPSGPVRPPVTPASGGAVTSISGLTIPITIQTTGDGRETYRQLYGEMNRLALANPQFRPVFALYPEPN